MRSGARPTLTLATGSGRAIAVGWDVSSFTVIGRSAGDRPCRQGRTGEAQGQRQRGRSVWVHTTISSGAGRALGYGPEALSVRLACPRDHKAGRAGPRPATGTTSDRRARARPGPAGPQSRSSGGLQTNGHLLRGPVRHRGPGDGHLGAELDTSFTSDASRSACAVKATVRVGCNAVRIWTWAPSRWPG